ncbi:SMP-30/gluconolactonase/LRE family protein [Pararhodobacter zhoushanensis]|uniref:SMP-30/gluconolactonase/LRE family protein n=1 Tax=Pararhodobacter zhoushanensis TaxID=2479545 RepID=UPI000F8F4B0B|nr:SMP-30/gluconolactonase/LRE family protein [Pararhodobacter zhoushanensis]
MTIRIDLHSPQTALLGESPLWDVERQRLWWVDARAASIRCADADGTVLSDWTMPGQVGSIGLAQGGLIAALEDGFYHIDGQTGAAHCVARVTPPAPGLRLNDGKADRDGRFVSGHMHPGGGTAGELWQLGLDGRVTQLETGLGITNALCVSPDGRQLYLADSMDGVIRRYDYDGAAGRLSNRIDLIDCRAQGSGPDGATVDSDGRLWVALVLAHKIACYAPDGSLLQLIDSPVQYPSCPAFGGAAMDTLFVTTIAHSGHSLISTSADAGRVMAIRGLGATGLPEAVWHPTPARQGAAPWS